MWESACMTASQSRTVTPKLLHYLPRADLMMINSYAHGPTFERP
jgi:hypothetical protein